MLSRNSENTIRHSILFSSIFTHKSQQKWPCLVV